MSVSARIKKCNPDSHQSPMQVLALRYARTGDPEARIQAIEACLDLSAKVARRYMYRGVDRDDLVQVAALGLVKALGRFDPNRGFCFSTFACPTMHGEIKRYFRDLSNLLRVPRDLRSLAARVEDEKTRMAMEGCLSPSVPEVASRLGVKVDRVRRALQARTTSRVLSIHEVAPGQGSDDRPMLASLESLGEVDPGLEQVERRALVRQALEVLNQTERRVIVGRFYEGLSQSRVASLLKCSQMQVCRIERRALQRMRACLEPHRAAA